MITINNKEVPCSEQDKWEEFKSWVEQTQLFNVLLENSGNPNMTVQVPGYLSLQLNDKKLTCFEDLPPELLFEFYHNSPFYDPTKYYQPIQKLLLDESNIQKIK